MLVSKWRRESGERTSWVGAMMVGSMMSAGLLVGRPLVWTLLPLAVVVVVLGSGCPGSKSTRCGDTVCPVGKECDLAHHQCVDPLQLIVCVGEVDGALCTVGEASGHCDLEVCILSRCGDGVKDDVEACDDGNRVSGDGCSENCEIERCGNGVLDPGEVCDDDNMTSGDGCSADCLSREICGNGIADSAAGEECDCGDVAGEVPAGCSGVNADLPGATCRTDCSLSICGDGIVDPDEECDQGSANSDTEPDACRTNCDQPSCGDGVCDLTTGDLSSCRSDCPGWSLVAPGGQHTCALLETGSIWCWGRNDHGQLGEGSLIDSMVPVRVQGISDAIDVDSGWAHTCAVLSSGMVQCWGMGNSGRLGDGGLTDKTTPVQVTNLSGAVQVAVGQDHTCARRSSGGVMCWGRNDYGELGDGSLDNWHDVPVEVSNLTGIIDISAGTNHSCAVKNDGFPWCWGRNTSGQCGDGTTTSPRREPVRAAPNWAGGFTLIAAGNAHSCAISGEAFLCWGDNGYGQLGDGTTTDRPAADNIPPNNWAAVAAFWWDNGTCGIKIDGTAWCWGSNYYGQLGDGSTTDRHVPVQVSNISGVKSIGLARSHACAVLQADDSIWCWGENDYGQLGDETTTNSSSPVRIPFVAE